MKDRLDIVLKTISLILGAYLLSHSFYMTGLYEGYTYAVTNLIDQCFSNLEEACVTTFGPFALDSFLGDPYTQITTDHIYLNWLLIAYVVIRWHIKGALLRILAVLITLAVLGHLLHLQSYQLQFNSVESGYLNFMQRSLTFRQLSIVASIALVFTEFVSVISIMFSESRSRRSRC